MTVKLPDDLARRFEAAGQEMDGIAEEALRAGAEVLAGEGRSELDRALGMPRFYPKRGSGELRSALGVSPMKLTSRGQYDIRVGFREPRKKQPGRRVGTSRKGGGYYTATNAMVANILEHGHRGSRGGQSAVPWWSSALRGGRKAAEDTVRRTVEGRLDDIFNKE